MSCNRNKKLVKHEVGEEFTYNSLLVSNVSDKDFVFCLDTIKTSKDFLDLSKKYCKETGYEKSYMYLSTYGKYIEVVLLNECNVYACMRGVIDFVVSKKKQWLIEGDLVNELNQKYIDETIREYYDLKKKYYREISCKISFEDFGELENIERDSLYVSFLKRL